MLEGIITLVCVRSTIDFPFHSNEKGKIIEILQSEMTNGISTWRPDQRGKNLFFVQKPFIGKPFMRCLNILWLNDELINWISITVERESVWKRGPPLCDSRATTGLLSLSSVSIWKHGIYAFIDSNQNSTAALNRHDFGWRISVNHTDGWRWQRGLGQSMCAECVRRAMTPTFDIIRLI